MFNAISTVMCVITALVGCSNTKHAESRGLLESHHFGLTGASLKKLFLVAGCLATQAVWP